MASLLLWMMLAAQAWLTLVAIEETRACRYCGHWIRAACWAAVTMGVAMIFRTGLWMAAIEDMTATLPQGAILPIISSDLLATLCACACAELWRTGKTSCRRKDSA